MVSFPARGGEVGGSIPAKGAVRALQGERGERGDLGLGELGAQGRCGVLRIPVNQEEARWTRVAVFTHPRVQQERFNFS